jgi:hypothetical protein
MKDIDQRDILRRERLRATQLSVKVNGGWQFATLQRASKRLNGLSYYRIQFPFGLVNSRANDPKIIMEYGDPGDYVAMDRLGELSLVKKDMYDLQFAKPNTRPEVRPVNSKKLSDPKFITDIVRKR